VCLLQTFEACVDSTLDGANLGQAAIDEEFGSIDEAVIVGSEEQDSLRNFIGYADPLGVVNGRRTTGSSRQGAVGDHRLAIRFKGAARSRYRPERSVGA